MDAYLTAAVSDILGTADQQDRLRDRGAVHICQLETVTGILNIWGVVALIVEGAVPVILNTVVGGLVIWSAANDSQIVVVIITIRPIWTIWAGIDDMLCMVTGAIVIFLEAVEPNAILPNCLTVPSA